ECFVECPEASGKQCERVRLLHEIQFTSEEIIERNQLGIALNNFVGSLLPRQATIEPKTIRAACSPLRCSHNSVAPTCHHHQFGGFASVPIANQLPHACIERRINAPLSPRWLIVNCTPCEIFLHS